MKPQTGSNDPSVKLLNLLKNARVTQSRARFLWVREMHKCRIVMRTQVYSMQPPSTLPASSGARRG
jgi:hypothetical protein